MDKRNNSTMHYLLINMNLSKLFFIMNSNITLIIIVLHLLSMHAMHAMEPVVLPTEKTRLLQGPAQVVHATPNTAWTQTLIEAAGKNDLKTVRTCLEHGAEINGIDEWQEAPLLKACDIPNTQLLVAFLLVSRADPNQANRHGMTPLHYAALHNNIPLLELLKKAGGNLNARDHHGWTPCHSAIEWAALDTIQWLHNNGVDMNTHDEHGGSPIHWAIVDNCGAFVNDAWLHGTNTATLHQLLAYGGHIDVQTKPHAIPHAKLRLNLPLATGATPFHVAAFHDRVAMKKVLLYHALFFDTWNKQPQSVNFLEMLVSPVVAIRKNARDLLQRRATKLREILCMQDSAQNTAGCIESHRHKGDTSKIYFNPDKIQEDMTKYLLSLETNCIDKLPENNMFKAAHDAQKKLTSSRCTIC